MRIILSLSILLSTFLFAICTFSVQASSIETPKDLYSDYFYTKAANFIAEKEGFRSTKYQDRGGFAIGYGDHELHKRLTVVTKSQAFLELKLKLKKINADLIAAGYTLREHEQIAILSAAYNLGTGGFLKTNLAKELGKPIYKQSMDIIKKHWTSGWQPYILQRRISEYQLFCCSIV